MRPGGFLEPRVVVLRAERLHSGEHVFELPGRSLGPGLGRSLTEQGFGESGK